SGGRVHPNKPWAPTVANVRMTFAATSIQSSRLLFIRPPFLAPGRGSRRRTVISSSHRGRARTGAQALSRRNGAGPSLLTGRVFPGIPAAGCGSLRTGRRPGFGRTRTIDWRPAEGGTSQRHSRGRLTVPLDLERRFGPAPPGADARSPESTTR